LVADAGPAGLALALQAHDHGAEVRVIDRRPEAFRPSHALIMHARSLEVLRPLAVTQALLARADTAPAADLHLGAGWFASGSPIWRCRTPLSRT
jgi:2-polyprenyl-6-methoxyphenol hydroxylase-like FAD-dependent oxidoreductase